MNPSSANPTPCMFDSHMHTPFCKHAIGDPKEYATRAVKRGLAGIIFTCHSPMPGGWYAAVRMSPEEFPDYLTAIQHTADTFRDRLEIRLGMKSDYFPGMENWLEELHQKAPFDYILGSVHYFGPEYTQRFGHVSDDEFLDSYLENLCASAESGLFSCLAHPDLIKNHFGPAKWHFEEVREKIARALDRIAATGIAMELNTSGLLKNLSEMNPGPEMLRMMSERGIPIVIGSDSHSPNRVRANFEDALDMLSAAGYQNISIFKARQRSELSISTARASLKPTLP